nr:retrovirus-related Pol polyprotein from transposon TNT 1-94 [Tanacetum cinerariifolium]
MHADLKYVESLEKEIDKLESDKAEFSNMYDVMLQECVSKDVMYSYLMSLSDLDALYELQCLYLHKVKECDCLAQKLSNQTESVSKEVYSELLKRFAKTKSVPKANVSECLSKPVIAKTLPQTARQAVSNTNVLKPGMYRINNRSTQSRAPQLPQTVRNTNPRVSTATGVNHNTSVSRPHLDSNHFACVMKMLNDVNARTKKPNVVPISTRKPKGQANKSVATSRKKTVASKTTNHLRQFLVMKIWFKEISRSTGFIMSKASITISSQLVNFVMRIWRSDLYTISLQESTSSTPFCLMDKATPTQAWLWNRRLSCLNFDYINLLSKKDIVIGLSKLKYVKHQLCSSCELIKAKRSSFKSKAVPSSKRRLNLLHIDLCSPMRVASINEKKYILAEVIATACYTQNRSIIISTYGKTPYHIINDMKPSIKHLHIFGCICYITRDGENLDKMKEKGDPCILVAYSTQSKGYRVYNKRPQTIVESITFALMTSNKCLRYAHVPSQQELDLLFGPLYDEFFNAVQTRRQLATDPKMCMFTLIVSTAEPKNINEAMADSAWIEAMQEELHQFDRLQVKENKEKDKIRSKPDKTRGVSKSRTVKSSPSQESKKNEENTT